MKKESTDNTHGAGDPPPAENKPDQSKRGPTDGPRYFYDHDRGSYWIRSRHGGWIKINEVSLSRRLTIAGFDPFPGKEDGVSEVDLEIDRIQRYNNIAYAGPLAGYREGVHEVCGERILVTSSPTLVEPRPGEWPNLRALIHGLLGPLDVQVQVFMSWLKIAVVAIRSQRLRGGQTLVIAGPKDCGKSLLQSLLTPMLGGRCAHPFGFMMGTTSFNGHLFAAEHLIVEDEASSHDIRTRLRFGAFIKQFAANRFQQNHSKGRQAVAMTPFWRLTITLNDEPECLSVLPPFDDSIADKIILLRAKKFPLPDASDDPEEYHRFYARFIDEIPPFLHHLITEWEIPGSLVDRRFGIRAYQNPELMAALNELSPEAQLLWFIDEIVFIPSGKMDWAGTSQALTHELLSIDKFKNQVLQLLKSPNACGTYLGRLAKSHPRRVTKDVIINGHQQWIINYYPENSQRVAEVEETAEGPHVAAAPVAVATATATN